MIDALSPYPFIDRNREISDGILINIGAICHSCGMKECVEGYANAPKDVQTCVNGYNYCRIDDDSSSIVIIGFLLKGLKWPKNHKTLLESGYSISRNDIDKIESLFSDDGIVRTKVSDQERRRESRILHDLKHLISALQRVVEKREIKEAESSFGEESWGTLRAVTAKVYKILSAIKNQIQMADYIMAPDFVKFDTTQDINIFGLFEKNIDIYNVLAESAGKLISPIRKTCFIDANRHIGSTFALLPSILLENAIKHSVGPVINIEAAANGGLINFSVKSFGPIIPPEISPDIWKLGYRYAHENATRKPGSGYGLYLAKKICTDNGFDIWYESSEGTIENGIPMGWNTFTISEQIKKNPPIERKGGSWKIF